MQSSGLGGSTQHGHDSFAISGYAKSCRFLKADVAGGRFEAFVLFPGFM